MQSIRFYEELNDFLPRDRRRQEYSVPFTELRSVKDLIEAQGVPHTEVDLILVNGESVGFDCLVNDGDRVSVYPIFESLDIEAVSKLDRPPLRTIKFIADVHLGKLVRRLRLLGFDCLWNPEWDDDEQAQISADEQRVLLTRDVGLLKRGIVTHGIYIRSDKAAEQLQQVIKRLDLKTSADPLARCLKCNGELEKVAKSAIKDDVPPRTYKYIDEFYRCCDCRKVYWKGTHWDRLQQIIDKNFTS